MLKKVEITNFKNFNEKFTFDLSDTNNFEFNQECIQNGIVNTGVIYGHNGCGKSNLGLAIFDLVSHLTDKKFQNEQYRNYLNANSDEKIATFKFTFLFDETGNNQFSNAHCPKIIYLHHFSINICACFINQRPMTNSSIEENEINFRMNGQYLPGNRIDHFVVF